VDVGSCTRKERTFEGTIIQAIRMLAKSNHMSNERDQHSRYVELCALLTTGVLSPEDLDDLNAHLATCHECRTLVADFQQIVRDAIPLLAAGREAEAEEDVEWNKSKARARRKLFAAIDEQGREERHAGPNFAAKLDQGLSRYLGLCALVILVAVTSYIIGTGRRPQRLVQVAPASAASQPALALQIAELTRQRDQFDAKAKEKARSIERLSQEVARQTSDFARLRQEVAEFEAGKSRRSEEISALQDENASTRAERDSLARQLKDAQASLTALNQDIGHLQSERVADLLQTASMQKTIEDLTDNLNSRDSVVAEQQKFLSSDRDIRELMGARDLLIADVSDVDPDGHSRRPFGRVFSTKNKSPVFYAFDLDKQPGLRDVKTFQAWGQNSLDKDRPVKMGMFYMDNAANRRWVLKFDNPKVMEQIDAVFVTVEPKGGSDKPSGKQLMYAYLRIPPNHP
jgi:hypothetical protein